MAMETCGMLFPFTSTHIPSQQAAATKTNDDLVRRSSFDRIASSGNVSSDRELTKLHRKLLFTMANAHAPEQVPVDLIDRLKVWHSRSDAI